jgi:hypothetical protein
MLPSPLRGFLHEFLEYSSTASKDASPPYVEVGLIQGLAFNPQGYIRTPAPPRSIKSSSSLVEDQFIQSQP